LIQKEHAPNVADHVPLKNDQYVDGLCFFKPTRSVRAVSNGSIVCCIWPDIFCNLLLQWHWQRWLLLEIFVWCQPGFMFDTSRCLLR